MCPTLCHPLDCSPPGSSVHGISQARILEWVACPSPGDLPDPGIEPCLLHLQADSLPSEPQGKPSGWKAETMAWNGSEHGLWKYRRGTGWGAWCQLRCFGVEVTLVSERSVGCGKIEIELLVGSTASHFTWPRVLSPPPPPPAPGKEALKVGPASLANLAENTPSLCEFINCKQWWALCCSRSLVSLEVRLGGVFLSLRGLKGAKLHQLLSDFFCWTFPNSSGGDDSAVFSQRPCPWDAARSLPPFLSPSSTCLSRVPQLSPPAPSSRRPSQLESLSKSSLSGPFPHLSSSDPRRVCVCVCVCVCDSVVSNSVYGILQAGILEWVAMDNS